MVIDTVVGVPAAIAAIGCGATVIVTPGTGVCKTRINLMLVKATFEVKLAVSVGIVPRLSVELATAEPPAQVRCGTMTGARSTSSVKWRP